MTFEQFFDAILQLVASLLILIIILTLAGYCLQLACRCYNLFAGGKDSPSAVIEPSLGMCCFIVLLCVFVEAAVSGALLVIIGVGMEGMNALTKREVLLRLAVVPGAYITVPVSFVVRTGIFSIMIPTTFPRALAIAFFHVLTTALIFGAFIAAFIYLPQLKLR